MSTWGMPLLATGPRGGFVDDLPEGTRSRSSLLLFLRLLLLLELLLLLLLLLELLLLL
jgi:hypothetical protein